MSDITRQKTIDYLYYLKTHYPKNLIIPEYIDFAISSLETDEAYQLEYESTTKNDLGVDWESYKDVDGNSLDDLILEVLQNNFDCGNTYGYKVADEIIGLLPPVTPQEPRWIPTSERLPKEDGEYYATVYDTDENYKYMDIAELEDGIWQYKDYVKVLAWMPLPQPYKAESEE